MSPKIHKFQFPFSPLPDRQGGMKMSAEHSIMWAVGSSWVASIQFFSSQLLIRFEYTILKILKYPPRNIFTNSWNYDFYGLSGQISRIFQCWQVSVRSIKYVKSKELRDQPQTHKKMGKNKGWEEFFGTPWVGVLRWRVRGKWRVELFCESFL